MLQALLVAGCGLLVSIIATVLVLHPDYEDGLFGRIALACIALAGFARASQVGAWLLARWMEEADAPIYISPIGTLLWVGLALFIARHAFRFFQWRATGAYSWRKPCVDVTAGKRRAA